MCETLCLSYTREKFNMLNNKYILMFFIFIKIIQFHMYAIDFMWWIVIKILQKHNFKRAAQVYLQYLFLEIGNKCNIKINWIEMSILILFCNFNIVVLMIIIKINNCNKNKTVVYILPEVYYLHEVCQPAVTHTTALYSKFAHVQQAWLRVLLPLPGLPCDIMCDCHTKLQCSS